MFEKRWAAVPPQPFTVDGGSDGTIKVAADACHFFKVKMLVYLTAATLPNLNDIEVKKILDDNTIVVGPVGGNINTTSNISAYTVALGAAIVANEQKRASIPFEEFTRAVYEEEPAVANRTILVDECGDKINEDNPLPVNATVSVVVPPIDVDIDALTPPTKLDPDNVLIVGSDDATKTGFKRALKSKEDGSLNVVDYLNSGTGVNGPIAVGTVAVEAMVGGAPLAGRRSLTVANLGTSIIYWGYSPAVTTASGTPIYKKQQAVWTVGPDQPVYLIAPTAGNNVRITEGA